MGLGLATIRPEGVGGKVFCAGQGGDRAAGGGHGAERFAAYARLAGVHGRQRVGYHQLHWHVRFVHTHIAFELGVQQATRHVRL